MSSPAPYRIPIVDLRAQYAAIRDQVGHAIDRVIESQQFVLGPAVKEFEAQMAGYLQCGHAVGVASGSDALLLALMALGIGPGDTVMTTPFTFFSTVSSITRLGATPLFVDIEPDGYLISAKNVESMLAEPQPGQSGCRIRAILPVHLFGECCAMNALRGLAKKHHVQIVEDVAQACGASMVVDGKSKFAGALGALGCFSFFPSKTLGGFGDGGMVTTDDPQIADSLRMLRMHGERAKYHHEVTGINSRLDSLQAAVLAVKLQFLEDWCTDRIKRADRYHELITRSGLMGHGVLTIPARSMDRSHIFNNYVVRCEKRDELKMFLAESGIQSEIYYPVPLHLQRCFADLGYRRGEFPQAELAASQVLALPLYPELNFEQQESVVESIAAFYRR